MNFSVGKIKACPDRAVKIAAKNVRQKKYIDNNSRIRIEFEVSDNSNV